jgi:hypothetical protein
MGRMPKVNARGMHHSRIPGPRYRITRDVAYSDTFVHHISARWGKTHDESTAERITCRG